MGGLQIDWYLTKLIVLSAMKKIQNKYSYLEQNIIGQGAYSKVYQGLNHETNENVAIKCKKLLLS
jgi:serine/threonine protein kinase